MPPQTQVYPVDIQALRTVIGLSLTRIVRFVLGPGYPDAIERHCATEMHFGPVILSIYPGRNEESILVENRALNMRTYDPQYWSNVDLSNLAEFHILLGRKLERIEIFGDAVADTGLCMVFEGALRLWIYYDDTDLLCRCASEVRETIDNLRINIT